LVVDFFLLGLGSFDFGSFSESFPNVFKEIVLNVFLCDAFVASSLVFGRFASRDFLGAGGG
jgi:hypothetical protein